MGRWIDRKATLLKDKVWSLQNLLTFVFLWKCTFILFTCLTFPSCSILDILWWISKWHTHTYTHININTNTYISYMYFYIFSIPQLVCISVILLYFQNSFSHGIIRLNSYNTISQFRTNQVYILKVMKKYCSLCSFKNLYFKIHYIIFILLYNNICICLFKLNRTLFSTVFETEQFARKIYTSGQR